MLAQGLMQQMVPILPAVALAGAGCCLLAAGIAGMTAPGEDSGPRRGVGWAWASLLMIGLIWLGWTFVFKGSGDTETTLFRSDAVSRSGTAVTLLAGALIAALSIGLTPKRFGYEFHAGLLFLLAGSAFVASAADLTTLYLGLEMVSIPTVMLLSIGRRDDAGREATLKYFTLSAFSSAIFLLGASYLYGVAGTTSLSGIAEAMAKEDQALGRIAMALVFGGLAFRITAVPFHFYAPDVFAGSSLPVAAMLATVPKVAGFLAIIRLLGGSTLESRLSGEAELLLFALALVTMTLGNCLALAQNVWRRLLAYSSVAHSGYLLLGVVAALHLGSTPQSILVYLAAYVVMTMGVFAGLAAIQGRSNEEMRIDQVTSLAQGNRGLAIAMTICLLSLIGIPLTAGFWAKFGIFFSAVSAGSPLILTGAVVMAINAAIAAIYYLRIIGNLLLSPSKGQGSVATIPWSAAAWTCVVCALVTVTWFIVPGWM